MADAKVKLGLDTDDFFKGLDAVRDRVGALAGVFKDLGERYLNLAKLSEATRRGEESLARALRARGDATGVAFRALQNLNAEVGRKLGIDDDDLRALQKRMSLQGVANEQLDEATKYTLGLAEVTGDMSSASRLVARALNGNVTALKRYLPQITDAASAQAELQKLWTQAEQDTGLSNQLSRLTNALDDFQIAIAQATHAEEFWTGAATAAAEGVENLTTDVNEAEGFWSKLGTGILSAGHELQNFLDIATTGRIQWEEEVDLFNIGAGAEAARIALARLTEEAQRLGLVPTTIDPIVIRLGDVKTAAAEAAAAARELKIELEGNQLEPSGATGGINFGALADATGSPFQTQFSGFGDEQGQADAEARNAALEEYQDYNKRWQAIADDFAREQDAADAKVLEQKSEFYGNLIATNVQGMAGMLGALDEGQAGVGPIMAKLLGTLASTIIPPMLTMATATTTSGVASSTLGTPLAIVTGPILAAAIALFGSAVSQVGGSVKTRGEGALAAARAGRIPNFAAPIAATSRPRAPAAPLQSSAFQDPRRAAGAVVYNVQFGSGPAIVGGSPSRVAADVIDFLSRHNGRLTPSRGS